MSSHISAQPGSTSQNTLLSVDLVVDINQVKQPQRMGKDNTATLKRLDPSLTQTGIHQH